MSPLLASANLLKLANTILNPIGVGRDVMHWLQIEGRFSFKSAYGREVGEMSEGQWAGWKWIWRLRV